MSVYFGAKTSLNRFSFLRNNSKFVEAVVDFPRTQLIFFQREPARSNYRVLSRVDEGKFGVWYVSVTQSERIHRALQLWAQLNGQKAADLRIKSQITAVFLGLDEHPGSAISPLGTESQLFSHEGHSGIPIVAVDLTENAEILQELQKLDVKSQFLDDIDDIMSMNELDAYVFSYAKMYLDWLNKNQFCPGCGSRVIPVDAGTRLLCTNDAKKDDKYVCPVRSTRNNNACFPRQDPVVITALRNSTGTKVLLGHNARRKNLDKRFFACFAGFMEPGETLEQAVVREVWEETGLSLHGKIHIVRSQPWPFPACLMVGCVATTDPGTDDQVNTELDKELDVCKWFDADYLADYIYGRPTDDKIRLPYKGSIAYELIKKVVDECNTKL